MNKEMESAADFDITWAKLQKANDRINLLEERLIDQIHKAHKDIMVSLIWIMFVVIAGTTIIQYKTNKSFDQVKEVLGIPVEQPNYWPFN